MQNYPTIFNIPTENERDDEGEQRDTEPPRRSGFSQFDILPLILRYCKETNETISTTFKTSVTQVFYVVSYALLLDKKQKEEYDNLRLKLRSKQ